MRAEWQNGYAEDCKSLDIGSIPVSASKRFFRDSSAVEQSAVNRLVVGSNPTRGAIKKPVLNQGGFFIEKALFHFIGLPMPLNRKKIKRESDPVSAQKKYLKKD